MKCEMCGCETDKLYIGKPFCYSDECKKDFVDNDLAWQWMDEFEEDDEF